MRWVCEEPRPLGHRCPRHPVPARDYFTTTLPRLTHSFCHPDGSTPQVGEGSGVGYAKDVGSER